MKIELIRLFMSDSFSGTRCEAYTSTSKIEQEAIREGQEAGIVARTMSLVTYRFRTEERLWTTIQPRKVEGASVVCSRASAFEQNFQPKRYLPIPDTKTLITLYVGDR